MNPTPPKGAKSRGVPVLVIDDSEIDRQVMCDVLTAAGYDVHELPSPIGATRKARELGVRAVVIDQNLPSLDGSKLAVLFKNNAGMQDLRVILVSSSDATMMNQLARASRADAFVGKHELHEMLIPTLKRLSEKRTSLDVHGSELASAPEDSAGSCGRRG